MKDPARPATPLPPEDPADRAVRWRERPWSVVARVGLSPAGAVGLRLSLSPLPYLGVEAGAGWLPTAGSVLALVRLPVSHGLAFTAGLGGTLGGTYEQFDPGADRNIHVYDSAHWRTAAFGLEHRSRGGWIFQMNVERFHLLNSTDFDCRTAFGSSENSESRVRPCSNEFIDSGGKAYWTDQTGVSIAVGHAF